MEFDKNRVYTALNADELEIGSKVICADSMEILKDHIDYNDRICVLDDIKSENCTNRFFANHADWNLAYLISEPEEKKLKWTDLKVGDIVCREGMFCMITCICGNNTTNFHVCFNGNWHSDYELEDWEKVE